MTTSGKTMAIIILLFMYLSNLFIQHFFEIDYTCSVVINDVFISLCLITFSLTIIGIL